MRQSSYLCFLTRFTPIRFVGEAGEFYHPVYSALQPQIIYSLRFTPAKEIELCGHGTLAAAHALYETRRVPLLQPIQFETVYGGLLTAQGRSDGNIELSFPLAQVHALPGISLERRQSLATALSVSNDEILFVGTSNSKLLVEITRAAFARLATKTINFGLIAEQGGSGVLVTARGGARAEALELTRLSGQPEGVRAPRADIVNDERFDFVSRCFLVQYVHCSLIFYHSFFSLFTILCLCLGYISAMKIPSQAVHTVPWRLTGLRSFSQQRNRSKARH